MKVICPKCGEYIDVELQKGEGALYMKEAKRISDMALQILKWWVRYPAPWMTKSEAYHQWGDDIRQDRTGFPSKVLGYRIGSFAARISELVAIQVILMTTDIRKLKDPETLTIRHPKKPRYRLADLEMAEEIIRRNGYIFWLDEWIESKGSMPAVKEQAKEDMPSFFREDKRFNT